MKPEQEQKLLQSLYDRIFQAITYAPDGKSGSFDPKTTLIQLSKNEAINPKDFINQVSPVNPNGDLNAANMFSAMVDTIPAVQADYAPTTNTLSQTYKQIVDNANTKAKVNPAQKETYEAAYNFLNTEHSIPNFQGPPTVTMAPSPIAQTYEDNQSAYVTAVVGYRTAQNGYDLTKPEDQRAWQAVAPGLQLNVDKAWNRWVQAGKQNVEQAQNAMVSTINDITSSVIASSQEAVSDAHWMAAGPGGEKWLLSYALPGDWVTGSSGATEFTLKSSTLNTESDSKFTSYGGGASWSAGLWSVGGSFNHSSGETSFHMDADELAIKAKLSLVRVMRPWMNSLLFRTEGWWLNEQPAGKISNGSLKDNSNSMLPLMPVAFVVMSDVEITANFSSEDKKHIESATSGSASVGWGPFRIGGSYSHSSSHDSFKSTFDGSTIKVPGMQIVAWVSEVTPMSAPLSETTKAVESATS
ncbi:hypothetical protein C942_02575 [Photobacterium marinum]|uniref:Uncharacterized protein n=1 Tax=Photobacterium marinum TaxID=1056511 RepID=L8J6C1_9GAMM|nr:hypothetical protein [Photobacterium marinum]ELR64395.1 hypothetical protein C942_02575 [Photobacterium marinum]